MLNALIVLALLGVFVATGVWNYYYPPPSNEMLERNFPFGIFF